MSLYTTLGIQAGATADEIKQAYRKLAREHHPDRGGDKDRFQEIEEAYRILSDKAKRAQYDSTGSTQRQADPKHQARNMIATVFSQALQANDLAERDYVAIIKANIEQNERKQHSDVSKCKSFIKRARKLIEVTEGEVLLGVLNQKLQVAQGQVENAEATLVTIEHATAMLQGCKCGADVEACLKISDTTGVHQVFYAR